MSVIQFPLLHPFDLSEQDTREAECVLYEYRLTSDWRAYIKRDWIAMQEALREVGG